MRFVGNIAHGVQGSAGLIPGACRFEENIGVKTGVVRSPNTARNNRDLAAEPTDADGFAAIAWHDLRPIDDVVIAAADAAIHMKSGQTIYLAAGTRTASLKLADLQNVTIRARRKWAATVPSVTIENCRNVRIEGLRIAGSKGAGVEIRTSKGIVVGENEIFDHASTGVRVGEGCGEIELSRNTIVFNGGAGVSTISEARILGNLIRGNRGTINGPAICVANNLDHKLSDDCRGWDNVDLFPGFADAEARDLRLIRRSLNRGRGYLSGPIGAGNLVLDTASEMRYENLRVVHVTATSADLEWSVSGGKSTQILTYGTDPEALETTIVRDTGHFYGSRHVRTLTGLKPGTKIHVRIDPGACPTPRNLTMPIATHGRNGPLPARWSITKPWRKKTASIGSC